MKIATLLKNTQKPFFSLEFFPPKDTAQWPKFFAMTEQLKALDPLFVSVTYGAGGSSQSNTLEITARLRTMEFEPMAHLTCVGTSSKHINEFLQNLRRVGVDNVLALRGDPPKSFGQTASSEENHAQSFDWHAEEFHYAADLVRHVRRVQPDMGLAVAGYPAPHPESASFVVDRAHTVSKIKAGADFVITQLFFDVREYFDLVDDMRRQGIHVPIIPGILPVQSLQSIRTVLAMCGANIPGKLYLQLEAAHKEGGEEAVREVGLSFAIQQIQQLLNGGAPGIHLYTLNRAELCLRLAQSIQC